MSFSHSNTNLYHYSPIFCCLKFPAFSLHLPLPWDFSRRCNVSSCTTSSTSIVEPRAAAARLDDAEPQRTRWREESGEPRWTTPGRSRNWSDLGLVEHVFDLPVQNCRMWRWYGDSWRFTMEKLAFQFSPAKSELLRYEPTIFAWNNGIVDLENIVFLSKKVGLWIWD